MCQCRAANRPIDAVTAPPQRLRFFDSHLGSTPTHAEERQRAYLQEATLRRRFWQLVLLLGALASSASAVAQEFELGFEGPDSLCATPGASEASPYFCTLSTPEAPLARAWSFGIQATNARIRTITTRGTVVDRLLSAGFSKTELTFGDGNEGAVSIVVLSIADPVVLPASSVSRIALFDIEATIPDVSGSASLQYVEGLVGSGEPVLLNVTDLDSMPNVPGHSPKEVALQPDTEVNCDPINPIGWVKTEGWNYLLPLSNPFGCSGGGEDQLLANWVAPHDVGTEGPLPGTVWDDIDFIGEAVSFGFEASAVFDALGLGAEPVWFSIPMMEGLTETTFFNRNVVDLQQIVDVINSVVPQQESLPQIFANNVMGVAQTYVENTTDAPLCVNFCVASNDSIQVWLDDEVLISNSACRARVGNCDDLANAVIPPGVHRVTVLTWDGDDDWEYQLSIEDPDSGTKFFNGDGGPLVFLGPEPGAGGDAADELTVSRSLVPGDYCASESVTVRLRGNGSGSGEVVLTETYETLLVDALSFSEISDGGVLSTFGDDGEGGPAFVEITWTVDASVLNEVGVSYQVDVVPGAEALPTGIVDGCSRVVGVHRVPGPWSGTGTVGLFDEAQDVGGVSEFGFGRGATTVDAGVDGELGTADDVYTIEGAGERFGAQGDAFQFAYLRLVGDFSISFRVVDRRFPDFGGRRAPYGIMARQSCAPDARYSFVLANLEADPGPEADHPRGDAVFFQTREDHRFATSVTDAQRVQFPDPDGDGPEIENQPDYLRLVRRGRIFSGFASRDGVDWTLIGTNVWRDLAAADEILVGAAYSVNGRAAGAFSFSEFSIGTPNEVSAFDNDSGSTGELLFEFDFASGELPAETWEVNTNAGPAAPAGDGAAAGLVFAPDVFDGRLRLTEEGHEGLATAVFLKQPVPIVGVSLVIEYTVYMSHSGVTQQPVTGNPDPGEGVTLAILAGDQVIRQGRTGKDLGYGGITSTEGDGVLSVAVEADTWTSAGLKEGTGSPTNDGTWHLGINSGGNVDSIVLKSSGLPDAFDRKGVRHRVVVTSDGLVSVSVAQTEGDGAAAGVGEPEFIPVAETLVEPLSAEGDTVAILGFTGSTGEVGMGSQTSEIDNITVTVISCDDNPETARITGPEEVVQGQRFLLDASSSDAGVGDDDETLHFKWEIASGNARIEGRDDRPTVAIIVDDGEAIGRVIVTDLNCTNFSTAEHRMTSRPPGNWTSYDTNNDGSFNIADATFHLNFLFLGGPEPECVAASDFDADGDVVITDPVAALNFLFLGGNPPAMGTGCRIYEGCEVGVGCP